MTCECCSDEIHPSPTSPDQTIHRDILGGAGSYSALGARLLSSTLQEAESIGWTIDVGTDFPAEIRSTIDSWGTTAVFRDRPHGELTTRGWNGYSGNEVRAFKYLTPKKRLTADDLSRSLLLSRSFHLICGGERCMEQVKRIHERRNEITASNSKVTNTKPLIVWEPVPDLCVPSELAATLLALPYIDVVSPNHAELGALFGYSHLETHIDRAIVEAQANTLLNAGVGTDGNGAIVVRCGAEGCYARSRDVNRWLPAYHSPDASSSAGDGAAGAGGRVIDPTGGGNGFLGGLAVGLVRSGDLIEAAIWGSVAASYCIEQVGMPELSLDAAKCQQWNGTDVKRRLNELRQRVRV
jgi:sugar/nucleoside kinase (ribokinase family)